MKVRFWGVRGSIPSPGEDTAKHGGNTSCYEIEDKEGNCLIFDAGTGIRALGQDLAKRQIKHIHLFISHTHWDHIQGFPFFTPIYIPGVKIDVYGPKHFEKTLQKVMDMQMDYAYFPISMQQLNAEIQYHDMQEEEVQIGNTKITTKYTNHPVIGLCYRIESEGKSVVYSGDFEPYYNLLGSSGKTEEEDDFDNDFEDDENMDDIVEERNTHHKNFCAADLLIHDAQYTQEEYPQFQGWGHTWMEYVLEMSREKKVGKTILTHHDPERKDITLEEIEQKLRKTYSDIDFQFSQEGQEIEL